MLPAEDPPARPTDASRRFRASLEIRKALKASMAPSSPKSRIASVLVKKSRSASQRIEKSFSAGLSDSSQAPNLPRVWGCVRGVAESDGESSATVPSGSPPTSLALAEPSRPVLPRESMSHRASDFGLLSSSNDFCSSSKVGRKNSSTCRQDKMSACTASEHLSGAGKLLVMIDSSVSRSPFSQASANSVKCAVTAARFSQCLHGDWPWLKSSHKVAPSAQTSVRWLILLLTTCSGGHHRGAKGCFRMMWSSPSCSTTASPKSVTFTSVKLGSLKA
mmetsp:Transcript_102441/g.296295  ORF Transcript_102441/g.296295 Transcript_102441/m.296295 type:complete len:276 (+) Transcript_102441:627-1454(+)